MAAFLLCFQYCVYEDFFKRICAYAKSRNIQVQMRSMYTPLYGRAWAWGHDPYRVSKIGDYQWLPVCFERMFNYENTVAGYYRSLGGDDFFSGVRGYPCNYFHYLSYSNEIQNKIQYDELVNLTREWLGAEQKADVAVMTYPVGLIGGFKNPKEAFLDNDNMFLGFNERALFHRHG